MAAKGQVVLRMTGVPFIVYEGEGRPDIERIEAYGHLLVPAVGITERLTPIENVIDLHPRFGITLAVPLVVVGSVAIKNSAL